MEIFATFRSVFEDNPGLAIFLSIAAAALAFLVVCLVRGVCKPSPRKSRGSSRPGSRPKSAVGSLEPLEPRSLLSTIYVTNTNASGAGSLLAAVQAAQKGSGNTVMFHLPGSGSGTISLPTGLTITAPISIVNPNPPSSSNPNPTVITLTTNGAWPLISVNLSPPSKAVPNPTVTLSGLTLYAFTPNILMWPNGTLNVASTSFQGFMGIQTKGGTLSVTNSTFSTLVGIDMPGGGNLTLSKDTFNDSLGAVRGQTSGVVTATSTTFAGASTAPAVALQLNGSGSFNMTGGSFSGNSGGGLKLTGGLKNAAKLTSVLATNNFAGTPAINLIGVPTVITGCMVINNGAQGIGFNGADGANFTLTNSTIVGNAPYLSVINGAGVWVNACKGGKIVFTNDTISGNMLRGGTQSGGGVAFIGDKTATITVTSTTIVGNTATSQGGGMAVLSGSAPVMDNNLIMQNQGAGGMGNDVYGGVISRLGNNNIVSTVDKSSTGWVSTDRTGTIQSPFTIPVKGLGYNEGSTFLVTMAPYAITVNPTAYGDQRLINTTDANGVLRKKAGVVIAGACNPITIPTGTH